MDFKILFSTFSLIFLAELGDKTQIACMLLAAETKAPWVVFLGTVAALAVVSFLGVMVASVALEFIPTVWIKRVAAIAFIVMGGLMLWGKI